MDPLRPPTEAEIRAALERLPPQARDTPLVPFVLDGAPCEIHLKLENLQPIGSFKLRGAGNAIGARLEELGPGALASGVVTASAGNMAQAVAWNARRLDIPCRVLVPDHTPQAKLDAIERLGGEVVRVPFDEWWRAILTHRVPLEGFFVHPVSDPNVVAGNGTIALEIAEACPEVESVLVPYGGGGLSCGIAAGLRAVAPNARVFACEVETAAPLAASLEAGRPVEVERLPSFVDGIGGSGVLPEMWPMASELLAGSIVVSLEHIRAAVRLLATRTKVVAEGAGASSLAAALTGAAGSGRVVCVVSGGNLDVDVLASILAEGTADQPPDFEQRSLGARRDPH